MFVEAQFSLPDKLRYSKVQKYLKYFEYSKILYIERSRIFAPNS